MSWSLLAMIVGMLLNLLGSVLLYKRSPLDTTGAGRYATLEIEWRASRDLNRRRASSRQGFGFLVCGFLIQGVGLFLPPSAVRLVLPNPGFACLLLLSGWGALGTCFLLAALLYRHFCMQPRFRPEFPGGGTVLRLTQPSQEAILNLLVVRPGVEVEWAAVATVDPPVTVEPAQVPAAPPFLTWNRIDQPVAVLGWAPPSPEASVLACRGPRRAANLSLSPSACDFRRVPSRCSWWWPSGGACYPSNPIGSGACS